MKAAQTRLDLYAAAELIRTSGLAKKAFTIDGRYCIVGALRKVTGDAPHGARFIAARSAVKRYLGIAFPKYDGEGSVLVPPRVLADWNDDDSRTETEVIRALRESAAQVTL